MINLKEPAKDLQSVWHTYAGNYFSNATILDIGAGEGKSKKRLQSKSNKVITQDYNRAFMDLVDTYNPIELFETNSFDVVTAFDVIEHVYNPKEFIYQCMRIAKKAIFITTPNWYKHPRKWHYTAQEFIDFFNKDLKYFARYKESEKDYIINVSRYEFINDHNIYALGILQGGK